MKTSDIISIHAPLNEKTKDLIKEKELLMMKEGAVIVNLGRGGIINEKDLAKVLESKNILVGLDVFEKEPINADNPLLKFKEKTLLSPHIAWTSIEARNKLMDGIYKNIEEFVEKAAN